MPDAPLTPAELQNVARFLRRRDGYRYMPVVWFDEPDAPLYHRAVRLGVLTSQSATQIHWTDDGVAQYHAALRPAIVEVGDHYEQVAPCGCRWAEHGYPRIASCPDAVNGECAAEPGMFEGRRDVYDAEGVFLISTVDDRFGWIGDVHSGTLSCRWPHCKAELFTLYHQADARADDHWKEHSR